MVRLIKQITNIQLSGFQDLITEAKVREAAKQIREVVRRKRRRHDGLFSSG